MGIEGFDRWRPSRPTYREPRIAPTATRSRRCPASRCSSTACTAAGVPLGVASSSSVGWLERHLDRLGLLHRFGTLVGADLVGGVGKPAPDVYLRACADLGADPTRSVALEDSAHGVTAAKAAGMAAVAVPEPHHRATTTSPTPTCVVGLPRGRLARRPRGHRGRRDRAAAIVGKRAPVRADCREARMLLATCTRFDTGLTLRLEPAVADSEEWMRRRRRWLAAVALVTSVLDLVLTQTILTLVATRSGVQPAEANPLMAPIVMTWWAWPFRVGIPALRRRPRPPPPQLRADHAGGGAVRGRGGVEPVHAAPPLAVRRHR